MTLVNPNEKYPLKLTQKIILSHDTRLFRYCEIVLVLYCYASLVEEAGVEYLAHQTGQWEVIVGPGGLTGGGLGH